MKYDTGRFEKGLEELGIELSLDQKNQFLKFYEMLIEKNKVMNLTAITEFDEVIEKHFLDSLSLVKVVDLDKNITMLDLGTGAGFPGIPLKITFPQLNITLVDSLKKRIVFLDEVITELNLQGIKAIHSRAEDLSRRKGVRETYELCVSRAVANLSTLAEYCLPFVRISGRFVSYKSGEYQEELYRAEKAVRILGGKITEVKQFQIGENKRSFICIEKIEHTSKIYPRKAGIPSKSPIS